MSSNNANLCLCAFKNGRHFATLLESSNQKRLEKLIKKLVESRDVKKWGLSCSLKHRRLKLKMCAFLSAKHTDMLLQKVKVHIDDVMMVQEKARKRPISAVVDELNPGRFTPWLTGADTSSWHEVARQNPDGEAFMT